MALFYEIHQTLRQEGPGDNPSTRKALSLLTDLPPHPLILDIGCGPGRQTIELATQTNGHLVAVDTYHPYFAQLRQYAREAKVLDQISLINASMFSLPFADQSFDVIWSEGAIYFIGFAQGLRAWRRLLKPGGYLAVSELAWLQPDPSVEVNDFWQTNYPRMRTLEENRVMIRGTGYREIGHLVLPRDSWWQGYYTPLEERIAALHDKYRGNATATQQLDEALIEIDLYRKHSDWYGYVFYIAQIA